MRMTGEARPISCINCTQDQNDTVGHQYHGECYYIRVNYQKKVYDVTIDQSYIYD